MNFIVISTAYQKSKYWKLAPDLIKRIDVYSLHNWTAYLALGLVIFHALFLLLQSNTNFSCIDALLPFHAPQQNLIVSLGVISFYCLIAVILTTQKRVKTALGFKVWKYIQFISYTSALFFIFHGVLMDPELRDHPIDFLDGEKLISEGCLIILLTATYVRFKYFLNSQKGRNI